MRTLNDISGVELRWAKPKRSKLQFELRAGQTPDEDTGEPALATMSWTRGSQAIGQWAGGEYRFSREGWLRPRALVRAATSPATDTVADAAAANTADEPIATFAQHGGALTFPDGRTVLWKKPKRLANDRLWVDSAGTVLVSFHAGNWRTPVAVTSQFDATALPELPLLLLLGQYLLVLSSQDDEAAITASVAAVIAST